MHEIGVLSEAIKVVERVAKENKVEKVKLVTLEIGELTGYLPVFFEKYFPVVTDGKPLFEGCELKLETVRGEGLCNECHALYNVFKNEGKCPKCGSRDKTILGGQEFKVKEIGF
ncbi:MAG: hydrogenase maturation nickel metallochaperone HypA [Clostridia bacterium]|nr:hydrogenase maturation nickel metallochaperone HypA [Clostridia bacterium]